VLDFTVVDGRGRNTSTVSYGGTAEDGRVNVTLTLSDVLEPGETLLLLRDGTPAQTLTSGSVLSYNEGRLSGGTYTYVASIVDASGNVSVLDLNGALPGNDFTFRVA
jgi:hypothetical protein